MQLLQLRLVLSDSCETCARRHERLARRLHREATSHVQGKLFQLHHPTPRRGLADQDTQENFNVVMRERDVVASLNHLDRLVDEARKRRAKAQQDCPQDQPFHQPVPYAPVYHFSQ